MPTTPISLLKNSPLHVLQEMVDTNYKIYFVKRKFRKKVHELNSLQRFLRDIKIFDAYAITHKEKTIPEIAKLFNLSTTSIRARVEMMLGTWEHKMHQKFGQKEAEKKLEELREVLKI